MNSLLRFFTLSVALLLFSCSFAQLNFPELAGTTLTDVEVVLPQDFPASYTVVLMPLQQNHEATFRTWEAYIKTASQERRAVDFYQVLPSLSNSQTFIPLVSAK